MTEIASLQPSVDTPAAFTPEETLAFLEKNGIIDMRDVEEKMKKARKESILKEHPYKIYQGNDGRWRTHLPDDTKSEGRKLIVKTSYDKLIDTICEFYESAKTDKFKEMCSLENLYPAWLEFKGLHVEPTTVMRVEKDWRKYYQNSDIVKKPICQITKLELDAWIHKMIREHEMNKHKYGNFSLIIRQMLEFAVDSGIIDVNPYNSIKIDRKRVLKPEHKKPDSTQVFTKEEERLIVERAWQAFENRENRVQHFAPLALIFIFYTGLRIGEVSALKFEDITDDVITLSRAVRCPDGEIIDHTKGTFGDRRIPLIPDAVKIIEAVKARRLEMGLPTDGYIFSPDDKPLRTYTAIQHAAERYCNQVEILRRSPHKVRKTMISSMLDGGINLNTARKIAGHMDEKTTLNNYYYDRNTDETQLSQLEAALA